MKTKSAYLILVFMSVFILSCKDKIEDIYTVNAPVYLSYNDLRAPLKVAGGQDIIQPGKIYFKDNYIFVNEYQKGIHVIDNSNPESPEIIKFIEIPGNVDMAIKDSILYADSYVDLVAIDISDMNNIKEVSRVVDAFPYMVPPCGDALIETVDPAKGVVTSWKVTEKKVNVENTGLIYRPYPEYDYMKFYNAVSGGALDVASNGNGTGTGGSMARFTLYDDYLYTVDNYMLRLFNISDAAAPAEANEVYVGWNIETIFPYDNKLFMGSTTGMYVYSLAVPSNPEYVSTFWHATGCDPVVVQDNLAYVTLRAGNLCGNNLSQLDVIDISNIAEPKLLKEYEMEEPYGLGIDGKTLFVCDGDAGLKIFNATDPMIINERMIAQYPDINAWDVIPLGGTLLMIGTDGLYQYDYSDPENITELSVIPIEHLIHE
jgi:hypothetical protein